MAKQASYRILRYALPTGDRYTGLAWNYEQAVLLGTTDFATYSEARAALQGMCDAHGVQLRWFDGSYVVKGELIEPCDKHNSDR